MRVLTVLFLMLAGPVLAQDWQALSGDQISMALGARALVYSDGATQNFHADGATTYDAGQPSYGHWRVEGNQYCSSWPPSDRWECYGVWVNTGGLDLKFVAKDASSTIGRYIDLR